MYASSSLYGNGTNTSSDGSYTITSLPTDNYTVRVSASGYITEYYKDTYNSNSATLVSVTAPNNTTNIDFTLDRGGSISGHVYQADGITPISNIQVHAELTGTGYSYGTDAITDSNGSYNINSLPDGNYRVEAQSAGYITEYYQDTYDYSLATPVSVTAPDNTPNINFNLDVGGTISGHVYQADGVTPMPGHWVGAYLENGNYFRWSDSTVGTDGSYQISGLPSGQYIVSAEAGDTGYIQEFYNGTYNSSSATPVSVTVPNNTPNIDFTLDVGGTISGHVYQSDGVTPIANAGIYASSNLGYGNGANTSSDGSYTITSLGTDNYTLRASASGYITEYYHDTYEYSSATLVPVTVPNNTPNINFTLDIGGNISGHVYQSDGVTPIANADIYYASSSLGYSYGASTSSDGSYTITSLGTDNYTLRVSASGYITEYYQDTYDSSLATPVSVTVPDNTPNINFTMDVGGTISGHVYQADGVTPISNVWIVANSSSGYGYATSSSSDGSYTITSLGTDNYTLRVSASGYITEYYQGTYDSSAATPVSVTAPNNTPNIDFTLDVGGTINGYVYQANGTTPISGALVFASKDTSPYNGYSYTASDGSYTITGLISGDYIVYTQATGYIREYYKGTYDKNAATAVSVTAPNNTPNIDFTLDIGGTISGHVYKADGVTSIAGAYVYASSSQVPAPPVGGAAPKPVAMFYTAADGSYTITSLGTDNYTIRASASGYITEYYQDTYDYSSATLVSVTAPNNSSNIDFTLDVGGTISGHVYKADGVTPIINAFMYAYSSSGYSESASTSADGSFTITSLPTDNYTISVHASGYITEYYQDTYDYSSATLVFVTAPNNTPNIDFTLDVGGTISGHVYQSDGVTPIAKAEVVAFKSSGFGNGTYTTSDGRYTINSLRTDNYTISVSAAGYITEYYEDTYDFSSAVPVSVTAPNNTPDIDFTLDVGGTISGHVYKADGVTPIAGAVIVSSSASGIPLPPFSKWSPSWPNVTSSDGSYTITSLGTDNYTISVSASGYITEYYQDTYDNSSAIPVSVTAPNNTPNINFILEPAPVPTVTSISPASGPLVGGTALTISGTGFSGATAVSFGGTPATGFTVDNDTQITATSPAGTGTVDVTVTTAGGTSVTSSADQFTYTVDVYIAVALQGGSRPDAGWVVPLTVKFFAPSADVLTGTPLFIFDLTTAKNVNGDTTTAIAQASGINSGIYDISAVTPTCLTNEKKNVVITAPSTEVDLGTLLEGESNTLPKSVNVINSQDFGVLASAYRKKSTESGYDAMADFDGNGRVNSQDFGLLAANYGKRAPIIVP